MDRRLAQRNVRVALVCIAISLTVFGLSFLTAIPGY